MLALGAVSLITDVSSEMVTAVLPLYVVAGLGLSPLGFGLLDGINNGVGALVRLAGGHLADRGGRRHKVVAGLGYGLSAVCKPLLLLAHTLPVISAVLAVDRTGKGLRTAPRDAMISLSTEPEHRGRAFGVHRAMDTTGALLGPLVAFAVLRATVDGYDAVFAVSGCVAAFGVLVLLLFVPRRVTLADAERRPERPPALRDSLALLRRPDLRRLTVCATLLGLTTVSDSFLYLLLQREGNLSAQLFPLLPLGTAAVFLLLAVPLGALADRVDRRRLFLAGHGVLLLGYGVVLSPARRPGRDRRPRPARHLLRGHRRRTRGRYGGSRPGTASGRRAGTRRHRPGAGPVRLLARLRRGLEPVGRADRPRRHRRRTGRQRRRGLVPSPYRR